MKKHRRLLSILAIAVTLITLLLFLPIFIRSETCLPGVSANHLSGIEPFFYPYPYPYLYPYPLPDHYCKYFPQVYSGLSTGPTATFTRLPLKTITRFPSRTPTRVPYRTFMPTATCPPGGCFLTLTPRPTNSPVYITRTATISNYPAPLTVTSKP